MKEIVRLAIILMLITGLAAGSLAYVNQITSQVIAEREAQKKIALIRQIFPEAARFEDKTKDGLTATLAFDAADQMVGLLTEGSAAGYGGLITFSLAVDAAGKIVSVGIVSHTETPGIGDKIEERAFLDQFTGKTAADPLTVDQDIDNISGATASVEAMADGVRQTLPATVSRFLGK
jgi:electron transport complex protein RnfG